jgi:hypothetical protein
MAGCGSMRGQVPTETSLPSNKPYRGVAERFFVVGTCYLIIGNLTLRPAGLVTVLAGNPQPGRVTEN